MLSKFFITLRSSVIFFASLQIFTSGSAIAQEPQRMLILATPNVVEIPPYEHIIVDARCLDYDRNTPFSEVFYGTGEGFSSIAVSKGRQGEIDLRQSIELGQVTVTGNGSTSTLRIFSNSPVPIMISIPSSSVVVPESFTQTDDLEHFPYILSEDEQINQYRLWAVKEWVDNGYFRNRNDFEELDSKFDIIQDWLEVRSREVQGNEWAVQPFVDQGHYFFALHNRQGLQRIYNINTFGFLIEFLQSSRHRLDALPTIHVVGGMDQTSVDATALSLSYGNSRFLVGRDFNFGIVRPEEDLDGLITNGIVEGSGIGDGGGGGEPVVFEDDGWVSRTLSLLSRGRAKLSVNSERLRPWQPVLAGMETGVIEARSDQSFPTLSPEAAASLVEARVSENLELVKARMGRSSFDDGTVRSEVRFDGALFNRFYVELFLGETRFATLTFEE